MPNINKKGIFREYSRTYEEQKLYDLEAKVADQAKTIEKLKSMISTNTPAKTSRSRSKNTTEPNQEQES